MHEHKVSIRNKHKYYPVVNCGLAATAKGAVESFLSFYCGYAHAPRPQILNTVGLHGSGTLPLLHLNDEGLQYPYCGSLPNKHLKSLTHGVDEEDPYFNIIYKYDHYSDLPWTYSYKLFDETFPNAKFILTERNPEDWYINVLGYWREQVDHNHWCNPVLNDYWSLEKLPPITCDFWEKDVQSSIDFQGLPFDEDVTSVRARALIKFYKDYNRRVKNYFKDKKEKLLLLKTPIEEKEFKLVADFLEKPMPKFGFFDARYSGFQQTGYSPRPLNRETL
jgi:hypothetical protein